MRQDILKLIKKGSFFLVFCLGCYLLFLWVWGFTLENADSGDLKKRLDEADTLDRVDILVLGSSRAYRHYDPRIFGEEGHNIFVLGSSAQTILQSEFLLRQYIEQLKPRLILFDIYPNMFTSDGLESTLDIINNCNRNIRFKTQELAFRQKRVKVWNYLLLSYFREILPQVNPKEDISLRTGEEYVPKGFLQKEISTATRTEFKENNIKIIEPQKEAFVRLIGLVKDSDVEMIFVQSPMQRSKWKSYKRTGSIDSLLLAHDYELYDFNNKIDLHDTIHFYDPLHLNQAGVVEFNKTVLKDLEVLLEP